MTEIKRKANAGECIKIVNAGFTFGDYANGTEMVVEKRENDRAVIVEDYGVPSGVTIIADYEYVVLEPDADPAPTTLPALDGTTLLPDEALGGVSREYREVKRKASVGERAKVVGGYGHNFATGDIVVATDDPTFVENGVRFKREGGKVRTLVPEHGDYLTLEPTEILVINNERFRIVDRKAAVGERVIVTKSRTFNMKPGDYGVCTLTDEYSDASIDARLDGYGRVFIDCGYEGYAVLEPLTSAELAPTPTPLSELPLADQYAENITVLTRKIAQLEKRNTALEERILALETDSSPSYVKVASGPVDYTLPTFSKAPKSAQQIRDEIVERAKADVNKLSDSLGYYSVPDPDFEYSPFICRAEFVVGRDKRKVTAILRGVNSGKVRAVGRSKCAPGETFNAHIGRVIALYRALGLEVPAEYLTCPHPEEVRVGDVVRYKNDGRGELVVYGEDADLSDGTYLSTAIKYNATIWDDSREGGGISASPSALKGAA